MSMVLKVIKRRVKQKSPYTSENINKKCIFVHVPKCAGISIEESIFDGCKVGHHRVKEYRQYNPYRFWTYFTFSFVRNPISRFESAFSFLNSGGRNPIDKQWAEENLNGIDTADQLVECMRADSDFRKYIEGWQHFRPQVWYLTDSSGNLPLNYIGRLETMQDDFEEICRRIGIDRCLPHKNKSVKSQSDVLSSEQNIAFLREEVYDQDIEMLGYE